MKRLIGILSFCLTAVPALAQTGLPIQRIFLYKNGMAYLERGGQISAPLELAFHREEMNDVLKTFTAWNPSSGQLYSVGYTTGIPTSQILGRYPFDLRAAELGLAGFLQQVKGAVVRVEVGGNTMQGRLVAISSERRTIDGKTLVEDHLLSLLQDNGTVSTVHLSEVRSLRLVDDQLQGQLESYLEVLASGSRDVTKELAIFPVPAAGPIRVAYLQQFPVWKTSYRLHLDEKGAALEGWAQVDNPTGESWDGVELTLVSGNPVSFEMDLYQPLYAQRETVEVPNSAAAAPRQYADNVSEFAVDRVGKGQGSPGAGEGMAERKAMSLPLSSRVALAPGVARPTEDAEISATTFASAETTTIQDYFEYKFPFPIRLQARQSAFLPFARKTVQAERLSIYNAETDEDYPYSGVELKNTSGLPIEAAPVTVLEQGRYAGEAVVDYTPRGAERLLSYGIDHDIVISEDSDSQKGAITRVKAANGVVSVLREWVETTEYKLRNRADRAKTLLIEHQKNGVELKSPKADSETDESYRFRIPLAAGAQQTFPVREVQSRSEYLRLRDSDADKLFVFLSGWRIPSELKAKLQSILELQAELRALRQNQNRINQIVSSTVQDQQRLRENLKALGQTTAESSLRDRYVTLLGNQENMLADQRGQLEEVQQKIASADKSLSQAIAALGFDSDK